MRNPCLLKQIAFRDHSWIKSYSNKKNGEAKSDKRGLYKGTREWS